MASRTIGREARSRPCHGQGDEPDEREREARQQQDRAEVVPEALDAHLEEPGRTDGQVARQGRRVVPGEDVEAGHGEGVGHGLAGQRAAEHDQVADRPWREDEHRRDGDGRDEPDPLGARRPGRGPGQADPDEGQPGRLVAGQRGQPEEHAGAEQPRVGPARRRAGRAATRAMSRPAPRASAPNTTSSRSGRRTGRGAGRRRRSGRCPRAMASRRSRDTPRSRATSAASRQARTGHDRADDHERQLGRGVGRAEDGHRARRRGASAAASRPRRPACGKTSGSVREATTSRR